MIANADDPEARRVLYVAEPRDPVAVGCVGWQRCQDEAVGGLGKSSLTPFLLPRRGTPQRQGNLGAFVNEPEGRRAVFRAETREPGGWELRGEAEGPC